MRQFKITVVLVIVISFIIPFHSSFAQYSFQSDYDLIEQYAKSVFYVDVYDSELQCLGNASGFVAFSEHYFITNQHVIEGASFLKIWDEDNNAYVVNRVLISDKENDIAILSFPEGAYYKPLEFQLNASLKRGQPVTTIGSPEGLQNTVSFGNISAFPQIGSLQYIQFTAPISHGSSGGVLLDDNGKVIGITSSGVTRGENIGFAIPIDIAQSLYLQWDKKSCEELGSIQSWNTVDKTLITEIPLILNQAEYLLYQGIFYNEYGAYYVGKEMTKEGIFTTLWDAFSNKERYYVWGSLDVTRCCDWQWEFVPANNNELPTNGSVVKVTGVFSASTDALDGYWLDKAHIEVKNKYVGETTEINMCTMSDTLERVQILNIIRRPKSFEGKQFFAYGRIAAQNLQDPYYDGSWKIPFTTKNVIPAVGTTVKLKGVIESGVLTNCTIEIIE